MPGEHELRIALATALRERDEQKARADAAEAERLIQSAEVSRLEKAHDAAQAALAAARRECEGLREDIAAWLLDRADQYETDDPIWVGIVDLAKGVARGDAQEAARHGELDADLYSRLGITEARRKEREDRLAGLGFDTRPLREQILEPEALAAPAAGEEGTCSWTGYTDNDVMGRCVLTAGHACPHQPEPTTGEEES